QAHRWITKARTTRKSKRQTGGRFDRPTLARLLTKAIYVGEVNHNGTIYPGEQETIVDRKIWTRKFEPIAPAGAAEEQRRTSSSNERRRLRSCYIIQDRSIVPRST